jgi:hypothetical protein
MKCKVPLFGIILLIFGVCLCISPVSGKNIDTGYSQSFDAASLTNPPFGEEIAVKFWITAVDNDIQDITVVFRESEAYIDESSSSYTFISGNQQNAPLDIRTPAKNTWSIAKIKKGETVTISFNAYPKTIRNANLNVGTASVTYTPILANNQKVVPITEDLIQLNADLKDSAWFKYDILQKKYDAEQRSNADVPLWNMTLIGITVFAGICAIVFLAMWLKTNSRRNKEVKQTKEAWKADLVQIREKLRGASESDIPQIFSMVDELLISDKMLIVESKMTNGNRQEVKPKKDNKGNTGGY